MKNDSQSSLNSLELSSSGRRYDIEYPPAHRAGRLGSSKMPAMQQVSKKRKFVADGVFRAELDEFLRRELGEDGYAG